VNRIDLKKILIQLFVKFPVVKEIFGSKSPLIVANYHVISDVDLPHIKHIYKYKNCSQFEKDLNFYLKHFREVSLQEIIKGIEEPEIQINSFFLTFDDGCKEAYTIIEPILRKNNIKAAFFLNSAFIDNKEMFYRHKISLIIEYLQINMISEIQKKELIKLLDKCEIVERSLDNRIKKIDYKNRYLADKIADILEISYKDYLQKVKPYMESWQVNDLISRGHYVGAHSIDHPLYSELELDEQIKQTEESVNYIVEKFSLLYKIFAIPHIDKGISNEYFDRILNSELNVNLIFGNSNLRKEQNFNKVIHRLIGENPDHNIHGFVNTHLLKFHLENILTVTLTSPCYFSTHSMRS